jgi:hypothetical protein
VPLSREACDAATVRLALGGERKGWLMLSATARAETSDSTAAHGAAEAAEENVMAK